MYDDDIELEVFQCFFNSSYVMYAVLRHKLGSMT